MLVRGSVFKVDFGNASRTWICRVQYSEYVTRRVAQWNNDFLGIEYAAYCGNNFRRKIKKNPI